MELEDLGISKEKLQELVVERVSEQILSSSSWDEDGEEHQGNSAMYHKLQTAVSEVADARVAALFEEHIHPRVETFVNDLTLQKTNSWGEVHGESFTFIEYLIDRAEKYLVEEVDFKGKTRGESGSSYNWKADQGRLCSMIDKHLQYEISNAMEKAMKNANSQIADGITETVRIKLAEVVAKLNKEAKKR